MTWRVVGLCLITGLFLGLPMMGIPISAQGQERKIWPADIPNDGGNSPEGQLRAVMSWGWIYVKPRQGAKSERGFTNIQNPAGIAHVSIAAGRIEVSLINRLSPDRAISLSGQLSPHAELKVVVKGLSDRGDIHMSGTYVSLGHCSEQEIRLRPDIPDGSLLFLTFSDRSRITCFDPIIPASDEDEVDEEDDLARLETEFWYGIK